MENQNNNSGVNTVLIVIIIMILVGVLVWFFGKPVPQQDQDNGGELKVDVNLPVDDNQGGNQGDNGQSNY